MFFVTRLLLAAFLGGQVVLYWYRQMGNRQFESAADVSVNQFVFAVRNMFHSSVVIMAVGLVMLCPALTAGSIAGDRERKIWHDLANSPLSGWSILMGKMVARLATVFAWVLVAMPIWAILSLLGGLDPILISLIMLALFLYGWIYAALGMLASVATKRSRDALGLVTSIICLLIFVPLAAPEMLRGFGYSSLAFAVAPFLESLALVNPVITLTQITDGVGRTSFTNVFGISLFRFFVALAVVGPALTLIAGFLLRPLGRRIDNVGSAPARPTKAPGRVRQALSRFRISTAGDLSRFTPLRFWHSAMAAKERRVRSGSRLTRSIRNLAMFLYLGATTAVFVKIAIPAVEELMAFGYYSGQKNDREQVLVVILSVSACTSLLLYYGLMLDAAGRMVMEKEQDTWTTLLSTPIEPREIYFGKAIGALWSWRWPIAHMLGLWAAGVLLGSVSALGVFVAAIAWAIQFAFVIVLGLRIGLNSNTHAAVVTKCVVAFLAFQLLLPMFVAWIEDDYAIWTQPTALATISLGVGLDLGSSVLRSAPIGVFWEILTLGVSAGVLFELIHSFDRRTGKDCESL